MMGYCERFQRLPAVKDALQDDESKYIFEARLEYLLTRNKESYITKVRSLCKQWVCYEVESRLNEKVKGIVIYGCGYAGKKNREILELCNLSPQYWCDSSTEKQGKIIEGLPVLSPWELTERFNDYLVIISSTKYAIDMYRKLKVLGFNTENILIPRLKFLLGKCGKQYFDVFKPVEEEYFIDAGGYIGDTIIGVREWTKENYAKIYTLEPLRDMYYMINSQVKQYGWKNIETFNIAVWDKDEELYFRENDSGSNVNNSGTMIVQGRSIDSIIGERKVTFIKMDVEGSELKALYGAGKTILRNRPRLAISIYHKAEDIFEIPEYLLTLIPEYKFYIRHYSSDIYETVLYAEV